MYQNTVAHQLLKFQNSVGFSQAKFPMFVASSSVPLGLWEEFRNGKEIALTPFFFTWYRAGWHTLDGGGVRPYGSVGQRIGLYITSHILASLNFSAAIWKSN